MIQEVKTLGALKATGYKPKSIKEELRENLISKIQQKETVFPGIIGFDTTVLPDLERGILSQHNLLFLGLRGQAKTRMARLLINLLDEWIPIVDGNELNDDPLAPISKFSRDLIKEKGDETQIRWLHRDERYVEKLATPDVSIADLIGDVDPIKAATLKLPYSDERVIHYGLIPRAHRCLFVINELPDLQARIQVSLFNILQEGDMQIRGFKLRLPLDIQFVFTANPEDYTNRGSIITPLKDRIESQILTHYPLTLDDARAITAQEASIAASQSRIEVPEILKNIIERITFAARGSELVDEKSGVSARLSISAFENLVSAAERRMLLNDEDRTTARLSDFWGVIPSLTGKVELVFEGEQEGPHSVALQLIGTAIKNEFLTYFPNPERLKKGQVDLFEDVQNWFNQGNTLEILLDQTDDSYAELLAGVPGLKVLVKKVSKDPLEQNAAMELVLHGLAEFNLLTRDQLASKLSFGDMLANMLDDLDD